MSATDLIDPELDVDEVDALSETRERGPLSASPATLQAAEDAIGKVVSTNPMEFLRQRKQLDGE